MNLQEHNKVLTSKLEEMEVPLRGITHQFIKGNPLNLCIQGAFQCKRAEIRGALVLADILEAGYSPVYIAKKTDKISPEKIMRMIQKGVDFKKIHFLRGEDLLGTKEVNSPDYYFSKLD